MKYMKSILILGLLLSTLKAENNSSWYETGKKYATEYWKKTVTYITDLYNSLFKDLNKTELQMVKKDNQINIIAPGHIAFDTNKADIKYEFEPILRDISKSLLKYKQVTINIKGYTDNTGSKEYNMQLSENRAKSVYKALSLLGIDRSKMSYQGLAAANPIASNETSDGRRKNRRVELEIIFEKEK